MKKKSRRGMVMYESNPFVQKAIATTRTGTKRITNKTGDKMMIVSDQGEIMAPAGFHHIVEVDKTQFVKLYLNGVKAFQGLTNPGIKVFEIIYRMMAENPGKDSIQLHFAVIDQDITPISETAFFRGVKELLEKEFIAESLVPSTYYINVDYIFNGDRLAFIKEVRLKVNGNGNGKKEDLADLEAAGQMTLEEAARQTTATVDIEGESI